MANREHVRRLMKGAKAWNAWRSKNDIVPDFSGEHLLEIELSGANLTNADLSQTFLGEANLERANLVDANLVGASLSATKLANANLAGANLYLAHLDETILIGANLSGAELILTTFYQTDLNRADLSKAEIFGCSFVDVDLSVVIGLDTCRHNGSSSLDYLTIQKSSPLPLAFLRGVGLPDGLIEYLPSLLNQPIQHYSCFISFSTLDQDFANRLHSDLQNQGVRCWFAPHDMPIGRKIWDEIDAAIRVRDRVLLILSEHSIKSDWVEDEVTKAFEEERKRGKTVLFPIRLDDVVMDTNEAWAAKLRARHIGDFTRWKEHDEYQKSFARVLRDLTVKKGG